MTFIYSEIINKDKPSSKNKRKQISFRAFQGQRNKRKRKPTTPRETKLSWSMESNRFRCYHKNMRRRKQETDCLPWVIKYSGVITGYLSTSSTIDGTLRMSGTWCPAPVMVWWPFRRGWSRHWGVADNPETQWEQHRSSKERSEKVLSSRVTLRVLNFRCQKSHKQKVTKRNAKWLNAKMLTAEPPTLY